MGRDVLLLVACAAILITVGYRAFPPSVFGKANTFFQILLVVLVLLLTVWDDHALLILREVCTYCVAAFVILSGFHYSIVVSRRLSAGE
jgi:cardiolipin synthase (CMP-forming)